MSNTRSTTGGGIQLPSRKPVCVIVNKVRITLYPLCWFCYAMRRSQWTIRLWEKKGILPTPLLTMPSDSRRLYTSVEILGYAHLFRENKFDTNTPVIKTRFPHLAQDFKLTLTRLINENPAEFGKELPLSDQAKNFVFSAREEPWKKNAEKMMAVITSMKLKK